MKLTWFAGTTIRIHIGGQILVADPAPAPATVNGTELVAGADRVFKLAHPDPALPHIDPATWRPRPVPRAIDEAPLGRGVGIFLIAPGAVLVDALGEPPAVLLAGTDLPRFGRWADGAVVVLFGAGEAMIANATALLDVSRPKVVVLAAGDQSVDGAIEALRGHLGGAALISLESALALEV